MKCPVRRPMRARATSSSSLRYRKQTPGPAARSTSRYSCLRAEQETTAPTPRRVVSRIQPARALSHGSRSWSSRACPAAILAMFVAGWKSSPSTKGTSSRPASSLPRVVLPEPDTPMITTTVGAGPDVSTASPGLRTSWDGPSRRSCAQLRPHSGRAQRQGAAARDAPGGEAVRR